MRLLISMLLATLAETGESLFARDIPWPPAFKAHQQWSAPRVSTAIEEIQTMSPDVIIAPLQDREYSVITDMSLQNFAKYWKSFAQQMRSDIPENESSNCNNYAAAMRLMANFAAMKSNAGEPIIAGAVVFHVQAFGGLPPTNENHSVVLFLTESGWWVAELQSGVLAPLARYPNRDRFLFLSTN